MISETRHTFRLDFCHTLLFPFSRSSVGLFSAGGGLPCSCLRPVSVSGIEGTTKARWRRGMWLQCVLPAVWYNYTEKGKKLGCHFSKKKWHNVVRSVKARFHCQAKETSRSKVAHDDDDNDNGDGCAYHFFWRKNDSSNFSKMSYSNSILRARAFGTLRCIRLICPTL